LLACGGVTVGRGIADEGPKEVSVMIVESEMAEKFFEIVRISGS